MENKDGEGSEGGKEKEREEGRLLSCPLTYNAIETREGQLFLQHNTDSSQPNSSLNRLLTPRPGSFHSPHRVRGRKVP